MKDLCNDDNLLIVLSPVYLMDDIALKDALFHKKIVHLSLSESLNHQSFELPIIKSVSCILELEEGGKSTVYEMSDKQNEDYKKYKYLCHDKLKITGTTTFEGKNLITVNADEITIEDANFILLLRLVLELKENKEGWVDRITLYEDGIVADPNRFQHFSRLRKELEVSLLNREGKKFIQNNRQKGYRISIHPDNVIYNRGELVKNKNNRIVEIAKKLP